MFILPYPILHLSDVPTSVPTPSDNRGGTVMSIWQFWTVYFELSRMIADRSVVVSGQDLVNRLESKIIHAALIV